MTGGPNDGAELYLDGTEPCLECGRVVGVDWDGLLTWHYRPRKAQQPLMWCRGSRTAWRVPA